MTILHGHHAPRGHLSWPVIGRELEAALTAIAVAVVIVVIGVVGVVALRAAGPSEGIRPPVPSPAPPPTVAG